MANKRSNKNRSRRQRRSRKMRGGSFNVPIHSFYPQNNFEHDLSREIANSFIKGGGKKNHSRKYLKGGSFLNNFGSINGASGSVNQITGTQTSTQTAPMPSYKV